ALTAKTSPRTFNRCSASSRRPRSRAQIATLAPSDNNRSAVAKPMPREAPVMIATLSLRPRSICALPQSLETATIQVERHAGNVAGALRAQECDRIRQFFRLAETAQRVLFCGEAPCFVLVIHAKFFLQTPGVALPQIGRDPARADGVDE